MTTPCLLLTLAALAVKGLVELGAGDDRIWPAKPKR